jgi:hypothetical protein
MVGRSGSQTPITFLSPCWHSAQKESHREHETVRPGAQEAERVSEIQDSSTAFPPLARSYIVACHCQICSPFSSVHNIRYEREYKSLPGAGRPSYEIARQKGDRRREGRHGSPSHSASQGLPPRAATPTRATRPGRLPQAGLFYLYSSLQLQTIVLRTSFLDSLSQESPLSQIFRQRCSGHLSFDSAFPPFSASHL